MKKRLIILLCLLIFPLLQSCLEEENVDSIDLEDIQGSWYEFSTTNDEYASSMTELIWTFNANNQAYQELILQLNGVVIRHVINNFKYSISGKNTIDLESQNSSIVTYQVYINNQKMKLGNPQDGYFNLTKMDTNHTESKNKNEIIYISISQKQIYPYNNAAFGNAQVVGNYYFNNSGKLIFSEDITSIGNNAFRGVIDLKSIQIPSTTRTIGEYAFYKCDNLEVCELPTNLESLSRASFENCRNLQKINIPSHIFEIPQGCFYGCKSLKNIELPAYLENIGQAAFAYCDELRGISIPHNVNNLGSMAFAGCHKLKEMKCYCPNPPQIKEGEVGTFYAFSKDTKIYVPKESIDSYKIEWSVVASQIYPL